MDITPILYPLAAGGFGGALYSYYNKLFSVKTYWQAAEHIAAGAAAGGLAFLGLLGGGYTALTNMATAIPYFVAGYAGTDVLDTLAQRYAASQAAPPQ